MNQKIMKIGIIQLNILMLLISGCKDIDFGQKALNYVENESRNDSNNLVDSDLKVRFQNAFNFGSFETIHRLETIKKGMEEHISLIDVLNNKSITLPEKEAALNKLSYVKMSLPSLLEIKRQLEQNKTIIKNLRNLCQEDYLKSTGISALGIVSPLASFREIEEMANQYKTQTKVQAILSNDPNSIGNSSDSTVAAAGASVAAGITCIATSCVSAGFLESVVFSITYSAISFIPSLIAKDKLKEQKKLLKQALDIYPQKVLSTDEVQKVSNQYCVDSGSKYNDFLIDVEKTQQDYETSWYKLYEETMNQLNAAESYLIPKQVEAIMYSRIDTSLLNEEDLLEFANNLLMEASIKSNELVALHQKVITASNCDTDFEIIEKFSSKLNEFNNQYSFYKNSKDEVLAKYFTKKIASIENQIKSIPTYYLNASKRSCER